MKNQEIYVDIYPVGLYRDIKIYLLDEFKPRTFLYWFLRSFKVKSYYNGFLCEPYELHLLQKKCGSGLTPGIAFYNYKELLRVARIEAKMHPNCRCAVSMKGSK